MTNVRNTILAVLLLALSLDFHAKVISINSVAELDTYRKQNKPYLVGFYMNGCGACKKAKPQVDALSNAHDDIFFLATDIGNYKITKALDTRLSLSGAPSFVFVDAQGALSPVDGKLAMIGFNKATFEQKLQDIRKKAVSAAKLAAGEQKPAALCKQQPAAAREPQSAQGLIYLQDNNQLNAIKQSGKTYVLFFSTSWCGPCKQTKPLYEKMAAEKRHIAFVYVDGDKFMDLKNVYKVRSYPTVVVIKGGREVARLVGACDPGHMQRTLAPHLG